MVCEWVVRRLDTGRRKLASGSPLSPAVVSPERIGRGETGFGSRLLGMGTWPAPGCHDRAIRQRSDTRKLRADTIPPPSWEVGAVPSPVDPDAARIGAQDRDADAGQPGDGAGGARLRPTRSGGAGLDRGLDRPVNFDAVLKMVEWCTGFSSSSPARWNRGRGGSLDHAHPAGSGATDRRDPAAS